ncbi:hypothetical protein [Enterobacter ludwigii]|uniref:hypothetical protein n=1 Tax=Enterobacter ludwigii TaxID=299767 RepID=UPI003D68657B
MGATAKITIISTVFEFRRHERLLAIQQWRETYGPGSNVVLPAEEAEELARNALASLEAEPAIHRWRRVTVEPYGPYPWHYGNFIGFSKPVEGIEDEYFYPAPPAPVVPDDVMAAIQKVARIRLDLNDFDGDRRGIAESLGEAEEALIEVVNRRAAMLQGADGNSPVIQDGSEDTKRLDWLEAQNKRLNEYYGTTYGWKFDANFQRNAMMLNDSNYPVMTVRQAIDEAIAAAPQQEETAKPKK